MIATMNDTLSLITFRVDGQLFGLDILYVREINKHLDLCPVPHANGHIRGLVNLRGQIFTVMDLKNRLGLGSTQITADSHNIIIKSHAKGLSLANHKDNDTDEDSDFLSENVSFLVDDIGDVVNIDPHDVDPPPAKTGGINSRFLSGVVKLDNELLINLNLQTVLKGA